MASPPRFGLPRPRRLARLLLRLGWGRDADAVAGDLAESLQVRLERGDGRASVWLRGWWEVVAAVGHGLRPHAGRGPGGGPPGRGGLRPFLALRLAARGLVRDPGTSVIAGGVLALGLAAAATFFAILSGLTRPLPVPEGHRIVRVDVVQPRDDGRALAVTGADLVAWRDVSALSGLGGSRGFGATLRDPGRSVRRVAAAALTPRALELLGVPPVEGRVPAGPDAEGAIVLGARLAAELSEAPGVSGAGDGNPVGRVLEVDGVPGTVVAVMPEGFGFPIGQSLWVVERPESHPEATYDPVGRLADGVSATVAAAQLQARWRVLDATRDESAADAVVRVRGFTEDRGESGELILFVGLVLVGVALLFIACANVANLLLVRASERVRPLAVQAALGAGRGQLALQLLLESLLLAALGGIGGLALAAPLAGWVEATMGPENFGYYWIRVAVDGPVVLFTASLVVGTAVVAGLLPIVRVLRQDVHGVLKSGSASGTASGRGVAWGRWFVGGQLALSCGALVAAGLTARSMSAAREFGRALPGDEILVATAVLSEDDSARVRAGELGRLRAAVQNVEGARAAVLARGAPGYGEASGRLELDGVPAVAEGAVADFGQINGVDPGFFELFDLEVRAGRALAAADSEGDPVAVVNEAFVARFWPGGSPLGRTLRMPTATGDAWFRVVGVVETAELGDGPRMREDRVYVPLEALDSGVVRLLVRAADGDAEALSVGLRAAVAAVAPDLPLVEVRTLASGHAFMTRAQGTFSTLAVAGGASGLLVAVVGLYGLLAFRVRHRRRELGVRKALGADGPTLVREVLGSASRQLLPAVAVGLALAWISAPLLGVILLGGDPRSPAVFVGVAATFLAAGLGAALVPALRAGRVEPATVLRGE
jgi:predicted permease